MLGTVNEAIKDARQLEQDIFKVLRAYEEKYNLSVTCVNLDHYHVVGRSRPFVGRVELEIGLP
jgi:hypothetical protein